VVSKCVLPTLTCESMTTTESLANRTTAPPRNPSPSLPKVPPALPGQPLPLLAHWLLCRTNQRF
jgi:hypothetical protein